MEIYQLRQFVAVAEAGSFTRGAERLGVSQPALSAGIAKLEAELEGLLFDRDHRTVRLTPRGEKMLERAREMLALCAAARAEIRSIGEAKPLVIGAMLSMPVEKVAAIVGACKMAFPDIAFEIGEGYPGELYDLIEKQRVDIAITVSLSEQGDPQEAVLMREPYLLACSLDHPYARRASISLSDLEGQDFIVRLTCEARRETRDLLKEKGVRSRIVARTAHDDRALNLVAAGIGIALMPGLFSNPRVARVPVQDLPFERTIVARRQARPTPHALEIFEFLKGKNIRYL